ncbi:MAG TPA: nucleotidyltransferase family protein [Bryobacteraceae bacterium]|jgi:hypothetical protein|nr:nucleotidyltransferase family protein [Bryobacteraceae bacterium]
MSSVNDARAILSALRFDQPSRPEPEDWSAALDFADRASLTPLLASLDLPAEPRDRVDGALARNTVRNERVAAAYREIAPLFDHVLLKGATHVPDFTGDLRHRVQYDLDLYVPRADCEHARDALLKLGYEPVAGWKDVDHLPAMVRKTGYEWSGDYFDPEMPIGIEIHFQFWDEASLYLRAAEVDGFWSRRQGTRLELVDRLGYAALHVTRHLLRGNLRAFHLWEIARFLHTHQDESFWRRWLELHDPSLRRLEAVAFQLAHLWFGCALAPAASAEIAALPVAALRWFKHYAFSPIESMFRPNKRELWLHLALCASPADRRAIMRRRLAPVSRPGQVDAIFVPEEHLTLARRVRKNLRQIAFVVRRAAHHARLLVPTLWEGFKWRFGRRKLGQ